VADPRRIQVDRDKGVLNDECIKLYPRKAISVRDGKARIGPAKRDLDGICIPAWRSGTADPAPRPLTAR